MDISKLLQTDPKVFSEMKFDEKAQSRAKTWGSRKIQVGKEYVSVTELIKGFEEFQKGKYPLPKRKFNELLGKLKQLDKKSLDFMKDKANLSKLKRLIWAIRQFIGRHLNESNRDAFYDKYLPTKKKTSKPSKKESIDSTKSESKPSESSDNKKSFKSLDNKKPEESSGRKKSESKPSESSDNKKSFKSLDNKEPEESSGDKKSESKSSKSSADKKSEPAPKKPKSLNKKTAGTSEAEIINSEWEQSDECKEANSQYLFKFIQDRPEKFLFFDVVEASNKIIKKDDPNPLHTQKFILNNVFQLIRSNNVLNGKMQELPSVLVKKYLMSSANVLPEQFTPEQLKSIQITDVKEAVALLMAHRKNVLNRGNDFATPANKVLIETLFNEDLFKKLIHELVAKDFTKSNGYTVALPSFEGEHRKWLLELAESNEEIFKLVFGGEGKVSIADFDGEALQNYVSKCSDFNLPEGMSGLTGEQIDKLDLKIFEKNSFFISAFKNWEEEKFISKDPEKIAWFLNQCEKSLPLNPSYKELSWNLSSDQLALVPHEKVNWNKSLFKQVFIEGLESKPRNRGMPIRIIKKEKQPGFKPFLSNENHYDFFVKKIFEYQIEGGLFAIINDPELNYLKVFDSISNEHKDFYDKAVFGSEEVVSGYKKENALSRDHPSSKEISNLYIEKGLEIGAQVNFSRITGINVDWLKFAGKDAIFEAYFTSQNLPLPSEQISNWRMFGTQQNVLNKIPLEHIDFQTSETFENFFTPSFVAKFLHFEQVDWFTEKCKKFNCINLIGSLTREQKSFYDFRHEDNWMVFHYIYRGPGAPDSEEKYFIDECQFSSKEELFAFVKKLKTLPRTNDIVNALKARQFNFLNPDDAQVLKDMLEAKPENEHGV